MSNEIQTTPVRFYEVGDVQRLRLDAKLYAIDFSRARISVANGKHSVDFDRPKVDVSKFLGGPAPARFSHSSAVQVEGHMLDQLIRLTRAERQACRIGVVYGWSSEQINRTPLSAAEIAEHKARISHTATVAKMQAQLQEAMQAHARRAKQAQESIDFVRRYAVSESSPDEAADVLVAAMVNAPTKPRRARQRRESVNHE